MSSRSNSRTLRATSERRQQAGNLKLKPGGKASTPGIAKTDIAGEESPSQYVYAPRFAHRPDESRVDKKCMKKMIRVQTRNSLKARNKSSGDRAR